MAYFLFMVSLFAPYSTRELMLSCCQAAGGHSPSRYFRIDWDWVKAALLNNWKLICSVTFSSHYDPTPEIASLKQNELRLYQLELTA